MFVGDRILLTVDRHALVFTFDCHFLDGISCNLLNAVIKHRWHAMHEFCCHRKLLLDVRFCWFVSLVPQIWCILRCILWANVRQCSCYSQSERQFENILEIICHSLHRNFFENSCLYTKWRYRQKQNFKDFLSWDKNCVLNICNNRYTWISLKVKNIIIRWGIQHTLKA